MKTLTVKNAIEWLDKNVGDDLTIVFTNNYGGKETKINMRDNGFKTLLNEIGGCNCDTMGMLKAYKFNKDDVLNDNPRPSMFSKTVWSIDYVLVEVDDFE